MVSSFFHFARSLPSLAQLRPTAPRTEEEAQSHSIDAQNSRQLTCYLTQGAGAPPASHQPPPRYGQHQQPSHPPSHPLPGIGQSMQHSPPQASLNRERERDSRERDRDRDRDRDRELERQRELAREDEMIHREREYRELERERELMDRYNRDQPHHPVQSHAGPIPIHQPVASKGHNPLGGPNGLLSNLGASAAPNPQQGPIPSSNAPGGLFGNQMQQHADGPPRAYLHQGQPPQQSMLGFNGNAPPQIPGSVAALAQGQQPILNDALSYLDQVKVRFVEQPDVYNRFLDIMKDFKSQAIDTPGVIQRVSTLFNGHPTLIQGFNTFLPPGYRIECGTEDNPDAIRVTTPSGTNTISMQSATRPPLEAASDSVPQGGPGPAAGSDYYDQPRSGWQQPPTQGQQQQQQMSRMNMGPGGPYSPKGHLMPSAIYGGKQGAQNQPQESAYDYPGQQDQQAQNNAAAIAHQQEQRGVSQLQSAVSAATAGSGRSSVMNMSGMQPQGPAQPMNNLGSLGPGVLHSVQGDMSKRGPVEFNHAISYVNKIKNRFADSPDTYKQFLEILQTYQRESKPIQDVYAQVTLLFNSAPDLLEDFKQFLPESAAQAKAQAAAARQAAEEATPISNIRGEPGYASSSTLLQGQNRDVKMPPLGQFNVKEPTKDIKKRRGQPPAQPPGSTGLGAAPSAVADSASITGSQSNRAPGVQPGAVGKRAKLSHKPTTQAEAPPAVSPTLVPALPEPISPSFSLTPSHEEYAFFDRVKKYIGNKQTFGEFLKLCNLYSADLIDRNILINRAASFIGGNQEIMSWFKRFMHVEPKDEIIEPKAKPESGVVNLSHCRALGPSYRLLPKRERQKPCSGRDDMCQSVLNDEWASHPTWASEDSGFVAHRKNQYEDSLHRIEEDRHDYDHHIEACIRTIQLMEPLVQQMSTMTEAERANFKLPPGLGGQSETIYRRIIKKIYDRERGQRVIDEMFARPCTVLPIVLARLKQKCEEWKASQREWDKVWREQMQKGFWRSLDHQAIIMKGSDKKLFVAKHIQHEIQAKLEELRNIRKSGYQVPNYQFDFAFDDAEVLVDATHLLLCHIDHNSTGFGADPNKVMNFLKDFIPVFFGMDREGFKTYLSEVYDTTPVSEEAEDETPPPEDVSTIRSRKIANGKKLDLLRDVLERRNEKVPRVDRDISVRSGSRASTPGIGTLVPSTPIPDPTEPFDVAELKWMEHPSQGNFNQQREVPLNESYKKKVHHLYCNLNIYCFIRTFEIFYTRLLRIKLYEKDAHEAVRRAMASKAAYDLGMIDKSPSDLLYDTDPKSNLYHQIVRMCEEVIKGNIEMSHMEETLRRFYLKTGWQLYNLDKILSGISRYAGGIFNSDPKDKSSDIINIFFKERGKDMTTHNQEIQYRKQIEKLIKEGDIYRVTFVPATKHVTAQLLTAEDGTLDNEELNAEARWSYYVSAFTMRDPTEGVPFSQMRMPFLKRNLPGKMDSDEEYNLYYKPLVSHDGLVIRICANSYHILYEPGTEDWWYRRANPEEDLAEAAKERAAARERRKERFREKFVSNPSWVHGLTKEEVDQANQRFRSWVGEIEAEVEPATTGDDGRGHIKQDGDIVMKEDNGQKGDEEMTDAAPEVAVEASS
ncbi:transcriptional repressor Sin3p [Blastomyces dermatitidis ATCC 18188]|uniref:Transcriptional repressor Sin3p n=1 Tax=Ajellomyces dermatitidis (strain ATCC 18188 / CBS 674.68) TaxID=653446 RepID=F2TMM3_AJEDA|nr:transcriptional repressor Sin3p [Blastomyces dermatitidis ATCC 18188]